MKINNDENESEIEDSSLGSNENDQYLSSSYSSTEEYSDSEDVLAPIDIFECEKRANECIAELHELERQFKLIKGQLCKERIAELEKKKIEIREERAEEYTSNLAILKNNLKNKLEVTDVLKEFRILNINNKYLAEEQAARQNFESEKTLLWDKMSFKIKKEICKLEERLSSIKLRKKLCKNTRKLKKKGRSKRKSAASVSRPYIVYMLKDEEIVEDIAKMKKSFTITKSDILLSVIH